MATISVNILRKQLEQALNGVVVWEECYYGFRIFEIYGHPGISMLLAAYTWKTGQQLIENATSLHLELLKIQVAVQSFVLHA